MTDRTPDPRIDRRGLLALAAGSVALGAAPAAASDSGATRLHGTLRLRDGGAIPAGEVRIFLRDPAATGAAARQGATLARIDSSGKAQALDFALDLPVAPDSPTAQVVAVIAQPGGGLTARGFARLIRGAPVEIVLDAVMY